jgi:hypothetical protein
MPKNPKVRRFKSVAEMRQAGVPDIFHSGADSWGVGGQTTMLYPSGEQRPFLKHSGHFLSSSADSTTLMYRKRIGEDEGEYTARGLYDIWGRRRNPGWMPGSYQAQRDWLDKVAGEEYKRQLAAHMKKGRSRSTMRYSVPDWQQDMVDALGLPDEDTFKALKLKYIFGEGRKNPSARVKPTTGTHLSAGDRVRYSDEKLRHTGRHLKAGAKLRRGVVESVGASTWGGPEWAEAVVRWDDGKVEPWGAHHLSRAKKNPSRGASVKNPSAKAHLARMQLGASMLREQVTAAQSALARGDSASYLSWLESLREVLARVSQDAADAGQRETPYATVAQETMRQLRKALMKKNPGRAERAEAAHTLFGGPRRKVTKRLLKGENVGYNGLAVKVVKYGKDQTVVVGTRFPQQAVPTSAIEDISAPEWSRRWDKQFWGPEGKPDDLNNGNRRTYKKNPGFSDYLAAGKRAAAGAIASAADSARTAIESAKQAAAEEATKVRVQPITEDQAIRFLAKSHGLTITNPKRGEVDELHVRFNGTAGYHAMPATPGNMAKVGTAEGIAYLREWGKKLLGRPVNAIDVELVKRGSRKGKRVLLVDEWSGWHTRALNPKKLIRPVHTRVHGTDQYGRPVDTYFRGSIGARIAKDHVDYENYDSGGRFDRGALTLVPHKPASALRPKKVSKAAFKRVANPSSHIGDIIRVYTGPSALHHTPGFEANYRVLEVSNDPGRARRPIKVAATTNDHGKKGAVHWIAVDQIVKVVRRAK